MVKVGFNVGALVKCVDAGTTGLLVKGKCYTVVQSDDRYTRVATVNRLGTTTLAGWYNERFELVQALPNVRHNDPVTSKEAAKSIKAKVPNLKDTILFLLARNPAGLTGTEIAKLSGRRLNSITPRFAELYRDSKITVRPYEVSPITTRNGETVWRIVHGT